MKRLFFCLLLGLSVVAPIPLPAQKVAKAALQSGPMVGYREMKEVMLWAQTTAPADVYIEYWRDDAPGTRLRTNTVRTSKQTGYTAHLLADALQPGGTYTYELFMDGKRVPRPYPLQFTSEPLWQWRTDPPTLRVAVGSCFYVNEPAVDRPGQPYGDTIPGPILKAIVDQQPDAMIWLGDNTYTREVDWGTRTGFVHRYTHTRSLPELQPLLGSVHHYATWDDHDYGPNDSDGSFELKTTAREVFQAFWANKTYGLPATTEGVGSHFQLADIDFYLLDNRWFRSANYRTTGEPRVLGQAQIDWLMNAMKTSRAPFKIIAVGGQVINSHAGNENLILLAPKERQQLIDLIKAERINGVIFVTGDRHHAELSKLDVPGGYPIYDFTTSPLSAGTATNVRDNNTHRVEGTLLQGERNFGMLEVTGPRTDRTLTIRLHRKDGSEAWRRSIKASELQVPK